MLVVVQLLYEHVQLPRVYHQLDLSDYVLRDRYQKLEISFQLLGASEKPAIGSRESAPVCPEFGLGGTRCGFAIYPEQERGRILEAGFGAF